MSPSSDPIVVGHLIDLIDPALSILLLCRILRPAQFRWAHIHCLLKYWYIPFLGLCHRELAY